MGELGSPGSSAWELGWLEEEEGKQFKGSECAGRTAAGEQD